MFFLKTLKINELSGKLSKSFQTGESKISHSTLASKFNGTSKSRNLIWSRREYLQMALLLLQIKSYFWQSKKISFSWSQSQGNARYSVLKSMTSRNLPKMLIFSSHEPTIFFTKSSLIHHLTDGILYVLVKNLLTHFYCIFSVRLARSGTIQNAKDWKIQM